MLQAIHPAGLCSLYWPLLRLDRREARTGSHSSPAAPPGAGGERAGRKSVPVHIFAHQFLVLPFSLLGEGAEPRGRALGGGSHSVGPT